MILCSTPRHFPYVPIVQRPRTWPFQGQNAGSNPAGDAKLFSAGSTEVKVLERRSAYAGSNKPFSVERNSFRKKQLLQALPLIERRLDLQQRELLAQFVL